MHNIVPLESVRSVEAKVPLRLTGTNQTSPVRAVSTAAAGPTTGGRGFGPSPAAPAFPGEHTRGCRSALTRHQRHGQVLYAQASLMGWLRRVIQNGIELRAVHAEHPSKADLLIHWHALGEDIAGVPIGADLV